MYRKNGINENKKENEWDEGKYFEKKGRRKECMKERRFMKKMKKKKKEYK